VLRLALLVCCLAGVPAVCGQDSLHGGIEIGGKGVKATVIRVTPGKEGLHTQMIFASTANTALSGLEDGKFRPEAVAQTAAAVGRFFKRMQDEYKVPAGNIYVVVSSGVPRPANFPTLVKEIKQQTGKDLRSINDEEEVVLSFLGAVKPELRGKSMLVDIGGGNTKGGYLDSKPGEAAPRAVYFSVPLGTVTFTSRVQKEGGNFAEAAARLRPSELVKPIATTAAKHPGLLKRQRIYLSGGTVWAMVTLLKPQAADASYVALSADDIERFHKLVTKDPAAFPAVNLDGIKDPKLRERAAKDVARVRRTYSPTNLIAGSEILRALSEALELKGKQVIFPRYGFIAWIQSYVEGQTAPRR
jgi:exopolyphosphatase/pppGpp-phosphohydrolase